MLLTLLKALNSSSLPFCNSQSRQLINDIYFYGYCLSLLTLIISLIIFLCFRWDFAVHDLIDDWLDFFSAFQVLTLHKDTNSHATFHLACAQLFALDFMVQTCCRLIGCHPREPHVVCCASHPHAVRDGVQLLLDVLWGRSSAFGARSCFHQGQRGHENFPPDWVVFADDLCAHLRYNEIAASCWQQTVRSSLGWRNWVCHFPLFSCWIEETHYMWILTIPVLILLICSTIFLINIVRVLLTKLHPKSVNPAPLAIKKAVRATLILVKSEIESFVENY